jgi:Flp pilus assembly pilin Flp
MRCAHSLWRDEQGFVVSTELVLVATLLVLAMVVGLQSVRDAVLAELADVAFAIGSLNQSYSFAGVTGHASSNFGFEAGGRRRLLRRGASNEPLQPVRQRRSRRAGIRVQGRFLKPAKGLDGISFRFVRTYGTPSEIISRRPK